MSQINHLIQRCHNIHNKTPHNPKLKMNGVNMYSKNSYKFLNIFLNYSLNCTEPNTLKTNCAPCVLLISINY